MSRTRKLAVVAALAVLTATLAWSQPGGRGAAPGDRPAGGMSLSAEQTLGILALDPELGVTDAQLLQLRAALRESYLEQRDLMAAMRGGDVDRQALRETMEGLRESLSGALAEVLTDQQLTAFQQHMANRRPGRGQGGGWRR